MYINRKLASGFAFIISLLLIAGLIGRPNNQNRYILTGVIIAVSLIASHLISNSIINPMHNIHKGTRIITQDNFEHKVDTDSKEKISQLSRAFDIVTNMTLKDSVSTKELKLMTPRITIDDTAIQENARVNLDPVTPE